MYYFYAVYLKWPSMFPCESGLSVVRVKICAFCVRNTGVGVIVIPASRLERAPTRRSLRKASVLLLTPGSVFSLLT